MNRLMSAVTQGKALGLHDAGWSLSWIGKHLGVTKGAVSRICAKRSAGFGPWNLPSNHAKPGKINATVVLVRIEEMHLEFIQIEVIHMAEFTYSRTYK